MKTYSTQVPRSESINLILDDATASKEFMSKLLIGNGETFSVNLNNKLYFFCEKKIGNSNQN